MPLKAAGPATDPRFVDRWDGGAGWIAHPDERMERASHALAIDGRVWVIDPVDAAGVDDALAELGDVAGVVVLLGRHTRDAATLARRHDVAVHVPPWLRGANLDAPIEIIRRTLADTGYRLLVPVDLPIVREAALESPDGATLVISDVLGTADYFRAPGERLGVHPLFRATPPRRALGGLAPERILVGHGEGVFDGAAAALRDALAGSRTRLPRLYARLLAQSISR